MMTTKREASISNDETCPLLTPLATSAIPRRRHDDDEEEEERGKFVQQELKVLDVEARNGQEEEEMVIVISRSYNVPSILEDTVDILQLGIPMFISRISFIGMKITDTALLGHVSQQALAASSLSDLWTMWSMVLIQGRVLGVFVGQAVGANNLKLAGIYAQISFLVISLISIFVILCWNVTEFVLTAYLVDGDNEYDAVVDGNRQLAHMAGYYSRVLSISIPALVGFSQLFQFFSAQRILKPEVNAATIGLVANLVLGLYFVLGWPPIVPNFQGYGFVACPTVTVIVTYVRLGVILIIYVAIQKLHLRCWDGWNYQEITWTRIKAFSFLYLPSALGLASDFWQVTVIGAIAARLGETEVAIFNTSYRIMWIGIIIVSALSGASSINMSLRLGSNNPDGAKQAGYVGIVLSMSFVSLLSMAIFLRPSWFVKIFTNDPLFLELFEEARLPFALVLFLLCSAVAIEKLPYSMGRTKEIFWYGFFSGWGVQVPGVILCTRYWREDLVGLYSGQAMGFCTQVIIFSWIVFQSDWKHYAELAQARAEASCCANTKIKRSC